MLGSFPVLGLVCRACFSLLLLPPSCLFSDPVCETLKSKAAIIFSKPLHILVPCFGVWGHCVHQKHYYRPRRDGGKNFTKKNSRLWKHNPGQNKHCSFSHASFSRDCKTSLSRTKKGYSSSSQSPGEHTLLNAVLWLSMLDK